MSSFLPIDSKIFYSSEDPTDPRLGSQAKFIQEPLKAHWHVLGYPDDEGIRLNGGRPGAALAPDRIRHFFYKMTPALDLPFDAFADFGNLDISKGDLAARHKTAFETVLKILHKDGRTLSFGGGHDYGYSDSAAFCEAFKGYNPLVVNFDAHLDVRPVVKGITSGTPFRRLLDAYPGTSFCEIGIQPQCNSGAHLKWLKAQGGRVLTLNEIDLTASPVAAMTEFLLPFLDRPRPVFISIDLDAFSSPFAPGCSQSWATGLNPGHVMAVLDIIKRRAATISAGLYEVSPPLDVDDRTARLAALLAHRLLTGTTA